MNNQPGSTSPVPESRLDSNVIFKIGEIVFIFAVAILFIQFLQPFAEDNAVMSQAIVWGANILMLVLIWGSLKLSDQKPRDFGIIFQSFSSKLAGIVFLKSLLVFVLAMTAFALGSVIMAPFTGIPESADMSSYAYMQNNLSMFLLTLFGVYIVSSFGEEVIYRAFLIDRISEMGLPEKWNNSIAIVISAAIFGFIHYKWGAMGMVQTGFMGLVLGYFYLKYDRNIWILVLAHAFMDTILMVQMYLAG